MLDIILELYDWLHDVREELLDITNESEEQREKCISIMTNIQNYLEKHGPESTIYMLIDVMKRETDGLDKKVDEEAYG